ncbi:hypothetical protein ALP75_203377 [Pseudomonas syringae pv. actinidiae]|nr:hypothetical protein ALP75_203377 [Pseudomonas syringae pv. actinidiae]
MVFDVTGTQFHFFLAFELVEQVARVLAEGVDQYVQTATVGHADHDFLGAIGPGALNQLVEHRNQAFAAFQTETLGAWVFGAQVLLETFRRGDTLKQVALDVSRKRRTTTNTFQTLHEPVALLGIHDVGELRAYGATICLLQRFVNFA